MRAEDARKGDVVLDPAGKCWQKGEFTYSWSTFSGMVGYYGPWRPEYGPVGELILLVRDGKPVPMTAEPGVYKIDTRQVSAAEAEQQ